VDDLGDLAAFVTNVRRGHPPSPEVVRELRRRYEAIGGRSPLNGHSAHLAEKLGHRLKLPVRWANRLWRPYVRDVLAALGDEGITRVALVPLAPHSAHVYAQDARDALADSPIRLECASNWGLNAKLCRAFAGRIARALTSVVDLSRTTVLMTAHSLPKSVVVRGDPYESELRAAARAIAADVGLLLGREVRQTLAFQSQALGARGADGNPIEWLGPDLGASLDAIAERGDSTVVVAPIGFLADHVEILYDLDIEARALAEKRDLAYLRAASLNADDDLVDALADVAQPLLAHA
jgi:ferrochelatase